MKMNGSVIASIVGTLGLVLLVTTAVLPGRTTAADVNAIGVAGNNLEKGALGL